jgi:hypothetical protein
MENTQSLKNLINTYKVKYKALPKTFCPYLKQEVEFTMSGFRHLIWKKGSIFRERSDINERFKALDYLPEIISKSGTLQEYEKLDDEYFCFIAIIHDIKYKVIILKTHDNRYKFVSIFPRWKTGKR